MEFAALADQFLDSYGLIAVFGIMLLKEIGIPVPIPSDLIMLGAAARAASGRFPFLAVFLAILIPMLVGGAVQYSVAKGPGRRLIYRIGSHIGLSKDRLDRAMNTVRKGGAVAVGVGLTTPGIRIAIVPASGLADLPLAAFVPGLIAGSLAFLGLHFVIGYAGGALLTLVNLPVPVIAGIAVAIFALGIAGWLAIRRTSSTDSGSRHNPLGDWSEAACPVCLAVTLMQERGAAGSIIPLHE
jgi:membrane protein DedA with SNARE-associated domain